MLTSAGKTAAALTGVVGVDVLPQLVHGAQADHRPAAEPERRHRPKLLMQTDEEFMQTTSVHNVLQVPIPERAGSHESNVNCQRRAFCCTMPCKCAMDNYFAKNLEKLLKITINNIPHIYALC